MTDKLTGQELELQKVITTAIATWVNNADRTGPTSEAIARAVLKFMNGKTVYWEDQILNVVEIPSHMYCIQGGGTIITHGFEMHCCESVYHLENPDG